MRSLKQFLEGSEMELLIPPGFIMTEKTVAADDLSGIKTILKNASYLSQLATVQKDSRRWKTATHSRARLAPYLERYKDNCITNSANASNPRPDFWELELIAPSLNLLAQTQRPKSLRNLLDAARELGIPIEERKGGKDGGFIKLDGQRIKRTDLSKRLTRKKMSP